MGFGIYFRGKWCMDTWPDDWQEAGLTRDLTFLEFFPILGALWLWSVEWANSVMQFWCDNLAVFHVINSLTSKLVWMMWLVRAFVLHALQYNIVFHARHIPGLDNSITKALSHQQNEWFRVLVPGAYKWPKVLPAEIWQIGNGKQMER